jgi:hypothetical protein
MHFYGISFLHTYKQSGGWQDEHPGIDLTGRMKQMP